MMTFFGTNDQDTLRGVIEYVEGQISKEMSASTTLRQKTAREQSAYAGRVLIDLKRALEAAKANGPTPKFIMDKVRKATTTEDVIEESILPGGSMRIEGRVPENRYLFINWLADHYGRVIWIQEIFHGQFGIGQYALDADTIRRVVLASTADTVCVRTRHGNGTTSTHTFDRGRWLASTEKPTERVDGDIFEQLALPRPQGVVR